MSQALKSCPKCNKLTNLVTLNTTHIPTPFKNALLLVQIGTVSAAGTHKGKKIMTAAEDAGLIE